MKRLTPLKSIRQHCLLCMNGSYQEIHLCPAKSCPFWRLRLGRSVKGVQPLRQIRAMCRQCVETSNDIRECDGHFLFGENCPVHEYRLGHDPKRSKKACHEGSFDPNLENFAKPEHG